VQKIKTLTIKNFNAMLRNIRITIRNLRRSSVYSFVNIAGLAISLATCAFIVLWVQDERSYDRFHKDANNIYLAVSYFEVEGNKMNAPVTTGVFAPTAQDNFAALVEDYCRLAPWGAGFLKYGEVQSSSISCYYSDPNFFDFFGFTIVKGNRSNPFQNPNDVVITEQLANQLFGDDDPIGKIVSLDNGNLIHVTAVMKNITQNTFLTSVDLVSLYAIHPESFYSRVLTDWNSTEFLSFLRLKKGTDVTQITERLFDMQPEFFQAIRKFGLQPLVNLRLYTIEGEPAAIKTVRLFQWVAIVILVIACINYVNLLTARASKRHREIGMKKILGARRFGLFMQLMGEALIMFFFAVIVGLVLNLYLQEPYSILSGKDMSINPFDWLIWAIYFAMLIVVTVLAGIYPAYMLSSYKTNVMQNIKSKTGNSFFRKVLVVLQFTASTALIAGTLALTLQMQYMRKKDPGYHKDNVMGFGMGNFRNNFEAVKAELEQHTSILGVTAGSENIMEIDSGHGFFDWEGKTTEGMSMHKQLRADTSYVRVMGLTLVDGGNFTSTTERQYILNEAAVKAMGLTDPVGKWVDEPNNKIVGVVKDFHFASLHNPIGPLAIFYAPNQTWECYIRIAPGRTKDAIATIEKVWQQHNPEHAFSYGFLDDRFNRMYSSDIRTGRLFSTFSIIAILISCLGLFGLVVFTAEMKTKEIGIRKVLGASIYDIIKLLTKDFLILVGISILIALPLAYYLLNTMLQVYAYRMSLSWWIFAMAGIITVVLTLLTVGWMAIKAAMKNPVEAIKSE